MIVGEAGVGKTRLAQAAMDEAASDGWRTEFAVASRAAASIPFAALAAMLPPDVVGADRDVLLRAMIDALAKRRRHKRLLVVVDDAHLLDDASAALVGLLATTGTASVIVTVRSGESVAEPITRLARERSGLRLDLAALSGTEICLALEAALDGQVDQAAARRLTDLAAGNLLYLHELVVGGLSSGTLRREDGIWQWRGPVAPSRGLVELVSTRLTGLDPEERQALETIAMGEPIEFEVLRNVVPMTVMRRLEGHGLVDVFMLRGIRFVRTSHPLHGEVIRSEMAPLRGAEVCATLADGFAARQHYSDDDAVRIARWGLEAGRPPGPDLLLRAAARLLALFDPVTAERMARTAAETGGGVSARLVLADALRRQGQVSGAIEQLESVAARTDDEIVAVADHLAQLHAYYLGAADRGTTVLAAAQQRVSSAAGRQQLLVAHAGLMFGVGRLGQALELCDRIRQPEADEYLQVRSALIRATVWTLRGKSAQAIAEAERMSAAARRCAQKLPWVAPQLDAAHSLARYFAGELPGMMSDARSRYERALAEHDEETRVNCGIALGFAHMEEGRVRTATRYLREAIVVSRQYGLIFTRSALLYLAGALALSGDASGAQQTLKEADSLSVAVPLLYQSENLRIRAGLLAVAGQAAAARRTALNAADVAIEATAWSFAMSALHDAARWGSPDAADRLKDIAPRIDGKLAPVIAYHAEALRTDDPEALDHASHRFAELGLVLYAAEAAACAGQAYQARGQRHLAAAVDRRANVLAAGCEGAATPALLRRPRSPLTPREEEIAAFAAAGVSDKDIAERLSLSVRTIHAHLRSVYAKLSVTSRHELRSFFGATGTGVL